MLKIALNPTLDFDQIKQDFEHDRRLNIANCWPEDVAKHVSDCLAKEIQYVHAYTHLGQNCESTDQELRALPRDRQAQFMQGLHLDAAKGIGFFYGRHVIKNENANTPPLLKELYRYLNSEAILSKIRTVSGYSDIRLASAKATNYMPGHFLTRHNDVHQREQRRLAYVLSFTPYWHPDWGGLLQFYQPDGTPRDAWSPFFNSLTIFDVNHIHAVTYVAPYAAAPRLSITGFFRAE